MAQYIALVVRRRKCPDCDAVGGGLFERIDHGCAFDVEVGRYPTLNVARIAACGAARAKGRGRHAGVCTGDWSVEGPEGVVAAGEVSR